MSFIWPVMLWFLLAIPLFGVLYLRMQRRRRRLIERYGSLGLVQAGPGPRVGLRRTADVRRHVPPAFFMGALTILILALARPQAVVSLPRLEGTVILAFDVSGSMAAEDIQPNRMEAAKAAAQRFVDSQPTSVLVGVIAFSDSGLSVQVPTNDKQAILASISRLAPSRGTSLANGIYAALTTIATAGQEPETDYYSNQTAEPTPTPTPVPAGTHTSQAIVLLTDGENTVSPDPFQAAQAAADRGVRIYTVGLGSAAGVDLEIEGFIVHTQLDEDMLKVISGLTAGEYYNAASEQDLLSVYDKIGAQLVLKPEKTEITSLFAGAGILIMLFGGAFSLLWLSRVP
jgi:Ca-activated chloride channel family protein